LSGDTADLAALLAFHCWAGAGSGRTPHSRWSDFGETVARRSFCLRLADFVAAHESVAGP